MLCLLSPMRPRSPSSLLLLVLSSLSLLTGCGGIELSDDIDIEFDFELTPSDDLHLPYVTGTTTVIRINDVDGDDVERTWTFESSDPRVLRIESQGEGSARCVAEGAGTVTLRVFNQEGEEMHDATITVADPDRVELRAHGPHIIGLEDRVEDTGINVMTDGTASLLVRYFRGGQRLFGNGTLTTESSDDITARPETTFIFENREWLQVTPRAPGLHSIELFSAGVPLGTLEVEARTPSEVASIELIEDPRIDTDDQKDSTHMVALGMARLDDGRPVYGVDFTWDLDGDGEPGTGDLFRYEFAGDASSTLGLEFDGLRAETEIRATEGFVDSSNDLGCDAAGRGGRSGSTGWALLMALAAGTRRRRGDA